jgi:hypothetical protein
MNEPTNPWAWSQWAQQQDPGTYGAAGPQRAITADDLSSYRKTLEQAGLWNPAWDSYAGFQQSVGDAGMLEAPAAPDISSLQGYQVGANRGPGHTRFATLYGPDGTLAGLDEYQRESTGLKDYLTAAALVGGGAYGMNSLFGGLGAAAGEAGIGTLGTIAPGAGQVAPLGLMGQAAMPVIPEVASLAGAGGGIGTLGTIAAGSGPVAPLSTMGPAAVSQLPNVAGLVGAGAAGLLSPTLAQLGGAALGALSSQDQEQTKTQTNEPWKPAQDWIKSNIAAGQGLQKQYTEQPFSPGQQTAYGNLYGLLNSYNKEVFPGLLSNANAMSQGYDRYAPKETRAKPSFGAIGSTWNPGLLKFGG